MSFVHHSFVATAAPLSFKDWHKAQQHAPGREAAGAAHLEHCLCTRPGPGPSCSFFQFHLLQPQRVGPVQVPLYRQARCGQGGAVTPCLHSGEGPSWDLNQQLFQPLTVCPPGLWFVLTDAACAPSPPVMPPSGPRPRLTHWKQFPAPAVPRRYCRRESTNSLSCSGLTAISCRTSCRCCGATG